MKLSTYVASALPAASFALAAPSLEARQDQGPGQYVNIHPKAAPNKCIGVVGGKFVAGAAIDVYDCNGSPTQGWNWGLSNLRFSQVFITNPVNGENFCMDIPPMNGQPENKDLYNGVKMVLKKCDSVPGGTPGWQSFARPYNPGENGAMMFWTYVLASAGGTGPLCVDLTDGNTANRNVLQLWQCSPDSNKPYANQIWTVSEH
ncbi:hypothetical protein BDV98DRAFT_561187 [Pterulicium gracile]|uniref:Uncharacterized protein n=1 Tax=Pterulicium gracile TaxID=1884261 RepID=A0A5C3R2H1_9AGAR|nr:hypothetical protein BDV98DRAFT_561187 [Pterula gracilis]